MYFVVRSVLIGALLAACVWVVKVQIPNSNVGVDDANIYLVYAQHLASGHGVVFNVGGERVEGFSDPLWVAIATVASVLANDPTPLLLAFNVLLVALSLSVLARCIERALAGERGDDGHDARFLSVPLGLLVAWCLASPGYVCWTTVTLMDAGLWSALLIASVAVLSDVRGRVEEFRRWRRSLALLVVALVACRSEAPLWAAVFLGLGLLLRIRDRGQLWKAVGEMALPLAMLPTALAVGVFARLAYFGHPLPNTYYAKVSPDTLYNLTEGWSYFTGFLTDNFFTAPFAAASAVGALALLWRSLAAAWAAVNSAGERPAGQNISPAGELEVVLLVVSVTTLVGLVTPVLVGGDHFGSFRFYQPIWPVLPTTAVVAGVVAARRLGLPKLQFGNPATRAGLAAVVALVVHSAGTASWRDLDSANLRHEFAIAMNGRFAGDFLNQLFAAGERPRAGVIASGGIKVSYLGEVVDLAGLNHIRMGHSKGDRHGLKSHAAFSKSVFYEILPDLIVPPSALMFSSVPDWYCRSKFNAGVMDVATKSLFRDERFQQKYTAAVIGLADRADPRTLCAYFRNGFLEELEKSSPKRGHRVIRSGPRQPVASS